MRFEDLYTARMAAAYLGISEQAVRQSRFLMGVPIHPRLRLYTRDELDWYRSEGVGQGKRHTVYPHLAEDEAKVTTHWLTGTQVAEYLGVHETAVRKNKTLQLVRHTFEGYQNIALWQRSAIAFYKANKPKPGRKDVAGYWAGYSPIGE